MNVGGKKNKDEATNVASLKEKRNQKAKERQDSVIKEMQGFVKFLERHLELREAQVEVEPNVINISDKIDKKKLN
tara:strand:+ start:1492 stop:1716 length:225 start_codon:yes stop_codon:yes gene_type:complete